MLLGFAAGAPHGQPATQKKLLDPYSAMGAKDPLRADRHIMGLALG